MSPRGSVSRGVLHLGGGVLHRGSWADPPPKIHGILRDTVNKRAVRILLECILVQWYLLPSAKKLRQGNIFTGVCQSFCSQGGCLLPGGVCFPRGCLLPGGVYPSMHWGRHPPMDRMTDRRKNITFLQLRLQMVNMYTYCRMRHGTTSKFTNMHDDP